VARPAPGLCRRPARFERFGLQAPEVFADLSKNRWDEVTRRLLVELAEACGLEARRDAMLAGLAVNTTEGRAVLHTALRAPRGAGPFSAEVHEVLDRMLAYAERVRAEAASGEGEGFTDIVNIGIGGSTSARAWRRLRCSLSAILACACTSCPTSTGTTSRQCCKG
jgi:glucose-6-phosphate isomerase